MDYMSKTLNDRGNIEIVSCRATVARTNFKALRGATGITQMSHERHLHKSHAGWSACLRAISDADITDIIVASIFARVRRSFDFAPLAPVVAIMIFAHLMNKRMCTLAHVNMGFHQPALDNANKPDWDALATQ